MYPIRDLLIPVLVLSILGYQTLTSLPIAIGALIDYRGFLLGNVGLVGTFELLGMAISATLASTFLDKINVKKVAPLAMLALSISQCVAAYTLDETLFLIERFFVGLSAGLLTAILARVVATAISPERLTALAILSVSGFGIIVYLFFPILTARGGVAYVYLVLSGLSLLGIFGLRGLPDLQPTKKSESKALNNDFILLILFSLSFGVVSAAMWTFSERIGLSSGLSKEEIGYILAVGTFFGIIGAAIAAIIGDKFGSFIPILLATSCLLLAGIFIPQTTVPSAFAFIFILFRFAQNFNDPFIIGVIARRDGEGRLLSLNAGAGLFGSAIGPSVASYVIGNEGAYDKLSIMYGIGAIVAFAFFFLFLFYPQLTRK
ncbi:MAG: MFS transporter [Parvibaculales bacterium]